jgi:glycosyltransferase involved in cell wall biosynthesis
MTTSIHAIIITRNEELHIRRCIESISAVCDDVLVIDSGSADQTRQIAEKLGATVLNYSWIDHATQINRGIEALRDKTGWLLRIDADEVLDAASAQKLKTFLAQLPPDIDGVAVQRRIHFMGRRMRFGGIEPSYQLRLWRVGSGQCEQRLMDEHVRVKGRVQNSQMVISDINLNSLQWWTSKHNNYATLEAIEVLNLKYNFMPKPHMQIGSLNAQAQMRRNLKEKIYLKLPSGLRANFYFVYRYIFRLGFLDGEAGYYFHLLQGLWYRSLVDARAFEIETCASLEGISIAEAISKVTGRNSN